MRQIKNCCVLFQRISGRMARCGAPFAAVICTFFLGGCAAVHRSAIRSTEVFFRAETLERPPEKPLDFPVQTLNKKPPGARVLGTFQFTTDRSGHFAMESAHHNARKCGADAIWVRSLQQWAEPYTQYIPAQTSMMPSTQFISGPVWRPGVAGGAGRWQRGSVMVSSFGIAYSPPRTISGWSRFTAIDAVMLQLPPQKTR